MQHLQEAEEEKQHPQRDQDQKVPGQTSEPRAHVHQVVAG